MPLEWIFDKYNYWISAVLMLIGFYTMISKKNFIKKIIGMNIFQTAIILFYISIADVDGGIAPILLEGGLRHADAGHVGKVIYVNPLPHVLMLTAIVVGVSTTAVALSLIMKIYQKYQTIEEDEILEVHR
ncbi:MAG: Na+/H+ antiporter subunit C [Candidatus Altiarchaeales archaeon]|nr:MAG: Na+/H+ antiporter subunit C [Candidatus Altiarchaeales archaeon]